VTPRLNRHVTRREIADALIWSFAAAIFVAAVLYVFGYFGTVPA
jgi:hypothetical protein